MKYTEEERLEIGKQIVQSGISNLNAAQKYGIGEETARRYRLDYEDSAGIRHITDRTRKEYQKKKAAYIPEAYQNMTKEELIQELMKSKINESRLKKGYMVKGDGASKEYFLLNNKNTKQY